MNRQPLQACMALLVLFATGAASADYTKIANNGWELPATAALGGGAFDWACTRDNVTGLVWEVKTRDSGLRDMNKTYTNYSNGYDPNNLINDATNSIGFVNAVNAVGLCGHTDWRLPSKDELLGLVIQSSAPMIDGTYFPNTLATAFWSGSLFSDAQGNQPSSGWVVFFNYGNGSWSFRGFIYRVRLVRAVQPSENFDLTISPAGSGAGTVGLGGTSFGCFRGGGVTVGNCAYRPTNGLHIALTATAAPGSGVSWGGACAGTSGVTCTLTMDGNKTVTADFVQPVTTSSLLVDPDAPTTVYAGIDGAGVFVSVNGGAWAAATGQPTNLYVKALAKKSGTPLYAGTYGRGVFKAASGTTFAACTTQPANANVLSLTLDAAGKLYAGTEGGVFVSSNQCDSWTALNNGLPN